jgi:creatinine amidohydrolase
MNRRDYILAETNWKNIKDHYFNIAILPWGATEAHNYHLPYSTDILEAEYIAAEAARLAFDQQTKVIVLPAIPFGVNTGQLDVKLCINMNPSTQAAVLNDIIYSLNEQNIKKLVIINSHGGNDFKQILRELQLKFPGFFLCYINWYKILDNSSYFEEPGDHAGEMETSIMLKIAPSLVLPLDEAGAGKEHKFRLSGLKDGWVWAQREWTKISSDTGVGNPSKASAEKGEIFLNDVTAKIATFLVELNNTELEDFYEK